MNEALIIFGAQYLIFVIAVLAGIFFFTHKKTPKKRMFIFGLVALTLIYSFAKIAGLIYYNPRPFVSGEITPLLTHIANNGFPSDHTLLSSALAFLVLHYNKKVGSALLILAIIVGFSRVLAGVHHSVDIIAAIVIAGIGVYITPRFLRIIRSLKNPAQKV